MTYVIDSSVSFGTGEVPEKKFPWWTLLGIPFILILFVEEEKKKKNK